MAQRKDRFTQTSAQVAPAPAAEGTPVAALPLPPKLEGLKAFTEAQNAAYAKASKRDRRVMVALDVLAALRAKRLKPEPGTYLEASDYPFGRSLISRAVDENPEDSFQKLLPTLPPCKVCAKGAIFACTVLRQNKVTNEQMRYRTASTLFADQEMSAALQGLFSPAQLRKIENEFECRRIDGGNYAVMGLQRFQAKRRMQEIMWNIVENDGTFKPVRSVHARSHKEQDAANY